MRDPFTRSLAIGFSLVVAFQSLTAQEVMLRFKYVPGDTWKTRTVTQVHYEGKYIREVNVSTVEVSSYRTEKVYEDSSADIISTLDTAEAWVFKEKVSSPRELLIGVPVLERQAANGKTLDLKPVEDVSSKRRKMIETIKTEAQIDDGFPGRPLKIGEKWENKSSVSYDLGEMRVEQSLKRSMKFIGFDKLEGVKCALVRMNVEVSGTVTTEFEETPVSGTGNGEILFDPESGKVLLLWMLFESKATISHKKGPMELLTRVSMKEELVKQ